MKKTDNKTLIDQVFFLKKLITADFCKTVYPNKKKTYALRPVTLQHKELTLKIGVWKRYSNLKWALIENRVN